MLCAIQGLAALVDENVRSEFDFELVFFFETRRILIMVSLGYKAKGRGLTYSRALNLLGNLGEVNLIVPMRVAQSVLVTVRLSLCLGCCQLLQFLDRTVPVHFEIDAEPAVHGARRHVEIDVSHPRLDNLSDDFFALLIVRQPDSDIPGS